MKLSGSRAYVYPAPVPTMPAGLVGLMEGLSREVLKNNPSDVFNFCAEHVRKLLVLRDGHPPERYLTVEQKIKKANDIIKQRAELRRQNYDNNIKFRERQNNSLEDQSSINSQAEIDYHPNHVKAENLMISEDEPEINTVDENIFDHNIDIEKYNLDSTTIVKSNANEEESLGKGELISAIFVETNSDCKETEIKPELVDKNSIPDADEDISNGNLSKSSITEDVCAEDSGEKERLEQVKTLDNSDNDEGKNDINLQEIESNQENQCKEADAINSQSYSSVGDIACNADCGTDNIIKSELNVIDIKIAEVSNVEICKENVDKTNYENEKNEDLSNNHHDVSTEDLIEKKHIVVYHGDSENNNNESGNVEENIILHNSTLDDTLHPVVQTEIGNDTYLEGNEIKNDIENSSCSDREKSTNGNNNQTTDILISKPEVDDNVIIGEQNNGCDLNEETITSVSFSALNQEKNEEKVEKDNHKNQNDVGEIEKKTDTCNEYIVIDTDITELESATKNEILLESNSADEVIVSNSYQKNDGELVALEINHSDDIYKTDHSDTNIMAPNDDDNFTTSKVSIEDQEYNQSLGCTKYDEINITKNNSQNDDDTNEGLLNEHETTDSKNSKTMDLETAAITIQKVFRNFLFRSKTSSFDDSTNIEYNVFDRESDVKDENGFASPNQIVNKDRRALGINRMDTVLQTVNEEKSLSLSTDDSSTISSAATVIQAHIRGFLVRQRLNHNKTISNATFVDSDDPSAITSFEVDPDPSRNKTVLNIHIVPEGGQFISRDESLLTPLDLSLDGSPPSSANLHPLGYDKSERRKQLKREDAIQSISPPSNNSKLSEEHDSVKEIFVDIDKIETEEKTKTEIYVDSQISVATANVSIEVKDTAVEENCNGNLKSSDGKCETVTETSSDESDVVTPFIPTEEKSNDSDSPKLLHSGEFHDVVLPTKVSRYDTSVVSDFHNVLVYFLVWNNS